MIYSLLDGEGGLGSTWVVYIIMAVFIVAIALFYIFGSKKRKKQEQDAQDLINAVKPGNKVKTIGGICGIVVEVDTEENTFVLETGTEASGKSYIKFDRQAIYQTDAVVEKKDDAITVTDDAATDVATEPAAEAPIAEAAVEAPATEEKPVEEKAEDPAQPEMVKKPKAKSTKKTEEEKQVKF